MKHYIYNVILITLLAIGNFLLPISQAKASPANPISISIVSAKAFQNIFATGDMLFVINYNIHYTTPHTLLTSNNFLIDLLDTTGTTVLFSRQLTQYEYDMTSIYVSPANVISNNLTVNSSYKIRITGNPALFATLTEGTNMATHTLSPGDWNLDGALSSKQLLGLTNSFNLSYIIDIVSLIQTQWATTLLITNSDGTKVLNSTGTIVVNTAIPGIDSVIPNIFQSTSGTVAIDTITSNATLQGNSTMLIRLGPQISGAFTGIGTWLGISQTMAGGLWALLFILTIASIAFLSSGNGIAAMVCAIPISIGLTYVGAIPVALLFTIVILLIAYTGYFLILRGI